MAVSSDDPEQKPMTLISRAKPQAAQAPASVMLITLNSISVIA
jgi:hypothetical protein